MKLNRSFIKELEPHLFGTTEPYITLPISVDSIQLNEALYADDVKFDYDMIDVLYFDKFDVFKLVHQQAFALTQPVIALDIDGVLANTLKECKKILPSLDETDWHIPGIDFNDFNYIGLEMLDYPSPSLKFDYYLTARSEAYAEDTRKWLELQHFPEKEIIFASSSIDKLNKMRRYQIDILIDDNPTVYYVVNVCGRVCYLYDAPYNRFINTNLRVCSLQQFEEALNANHSLI